MNYTKKQLKAMVRRGTAQFKQNRKFLLDLARMQPRKLDQWILEEHHTEFSRIDCLECANCCKTISPSVTDTDVRRLASFLKMKMSEVIDNYLLPDQDEDFVFRNTPCPFLGEDNYCSVYEARPRACREYPHTDRKRFHQILRLTARNTTVCPAVFGMVERMRN